MNVRTKRKKNYAILANIILWVITYPFRIFVLNKKYDFPNIPKSLLIVRLDQIGDVLLSTPLYHSIKDKFHDTKIIVLCASWAKELIQYNPYIDEIIVLDCPWWTSKKIVKKTTNIFLYELLITIKKIRKQNIQVFIDLRGDLRHIFLFGWLTNIKIRISFDRSGGKFLLTDVVPNENNVHEIVRNYRLFNKFNITNFYWKVEVYDSRENPPMDLSSKIGKEIDLFIENFIVIFNGGSSRLRRLNNSKVAWLCERIIKDYGFKCCYVGDTSDYQDGVVIRGLLLNNSGENFINLCGKLTLLDVRYLITLSKLFIGTDSSVAHVAGSTETPSISLFGPVNPMQSKLLGDHREFIYHPYSCSPCLQVKCKLNNSKIHSQCMEDITVDEIITKVNLLLSN